MRKYSIDVTVTSDYIYSKVSEGDSDLLDSTFKLDSVLPKTVHAVVCSVVSDALAKAFNDLLSSKEERK